MQYKQNGDCGRAIPLLKPMAERGHGFEVAQFQLGQCYLETARGASAAQAAEDRAAAAGWIIKAANSEVPGAQEMAARLYADGTGVASDPIEAAKWFLLVSRNPTRGIFGPVILDAEFEQQLRRRLSDDDWKKAQARADQWQPVEQPVNAPPATEPRARSGSR